MLEYEASVIGAWLASIWLPFVRIGSFMLAAPVVGAQLVPARIRLILALLVTLLIFPNLPPLPAMELVSVGAFILIGQQILIGIAMGLVLQVLLQMFVVGGQIIAMKMGLGFASMVDPSNGVQVTVVSQFHLMLATLLFLSMNGHLAMLEVLNESFVVLPLMGGFLAAESLLGLASFGAWMFAGAMLMALPAVSALFIINSAIAVVTRAAPQLNIFAVGFPFMLLMGLIIIWASTGGYLPHFDQHTREALDMMKMIVAN